MEQVKPTEALEGTEVADAENPKPVVTMEILITSMMQPGSTSLSQGRNNIG